MKLLLFVLASIWIPDLIEADRCNVCDPTCRCVDCYRGPVHGPGKKRETVEEGGAVVEKLAPVKREVAIGYTVQKRDRCNVCDPTCRWVDCYRGPVHGKKREAAEDVVEKRGAQVCPGETYPSCICVRNSLAVGRK